MSPIIEKILLLLIGGIGAKIISVTAKYLRSFMSGRGKIKRIIEKEINIDFKSAIKKECGLDVFKRSIKIEWAEKVDKDTYLNKEGDLVIKLSYSDDKNQSRSFAKALMFYLEETFIPEAKPFIGNDVHQGCKLTLAKEVTFKKDTESYRHFLALYLSPLLLTDHNLELLMNKLDVLSQRGIFRSIMLRELYLLCDKGVLPKSEMRKEVKDFVEFLWNICDKKNYVATHGAEPPLSFISKYIKLAIVLVKRRITPNINMHIVAVEYAFNNGASNVYVTGWGEDNIGYIKRVVGQVAEKGYKKTCETKYSAIFDDSIKEGICYLINR